MEELQRVQELIAELQGRGWTLAAIADELAVHWDTVNGWKRGQHPPQNPKLVAIALEGLAKRRKVPKRRRYAKKGP